MIQKTISIICDGCGAGIDHYPGYTKAEAVRVFMDGRGIIKGGKHFCDNKCLKEYKKQNGGE